MKKNIYKVLACVLAVTLTLTGTGTVAFAAEPGTENSGTSSGYTFSLGSFDDLRKAAEEAAVTEESAAEEVVEAAEEPAAVEEVVEAAEKPAAVEEVVEAAEEPAAAEEVVEAAEDPAVAEEVAEADVSAPVQTYSAAAPSTAKTSSNGSFNLGDFWTIGSFNLGSFWDMMEQASKPKEPEYVTVSTYYCNCSACFHTTDYDALKQHMYQHVIRGERNSYHTVVEKVPKK